MQTLSPSFPEIKLTEHARQRLKERLNIHDHKIQKFLQKAWNSKDDYARRTRKKEFDNAAWQELYGKDKRIIRELMGYTFVFVRDRGELLLVTFMI